MNKFLLSVHVLAAIVAIGSISVAASLFPRYAREALTGPEAGRARAGAVAALLHRVTRVYSIAGLAVPVFGMVLGSAMGVLGDAWLIASMILTALAAGLLALAILPEQEAMMAAVDGVAETGPEGSEAAEQAAERTAAEQVAEQTAAEQTAERTAAEQVAVTAGGTPAEVAARAPRMAMFVGIFNLLWAAVTVLMIVRPGSTTGA